MTRPSPTSRAGALVVAAVLLGEYRLTEPAPKKPSELVGRPGGIVRRYNLITHPVAADARPTGVHPVSAPWTCDDPTASMSDEQFEACMDDDWDCSVLGNMICGTPYIEGSIPGKDDG